MDFTQGFSSCIPFQVRSKLSHRDAHHVCSLPEGQRGSSVLPLITLDMVYEMVIWAFQWIRMCCTRRQKGMFQKCLRSLFTLNETQKHLSLKEWTTLCPFGWTTNLGEHEPSVLLKWLVVPNYFNPRLSKVSGIHKGHSSSGVKEQCEEPRDSREAQQWTLCLCQSILCSGTLPCAHTEKVSISFKAETNAWLPIFQWGWATTQNQSWHPPYAIWTKRLHL